jgi:hypothetical protein
MPTSAPTQDFTITIFGSQQVTNAILQVSVPAEGGPPVPSNPFQLIFAPAQQLVLQAPNTAFVGHAFDVRVTAQDTAGRIAAGFTGPLTIIAALNGNGTPKPWDRSQ